jgi:VanZ family protein
MKVEANELQRKAVRAVRVAAWLAVVALVVLTVVPPSMRPESGFPSAVEHFAGFFLAGLLNHLGYPRRLSTSLVIAVAFAAGIELLQFASPGRHPRFSDFVVDAVAACAGNVVGYLLIRFAPIWLGEKGMLLPWKG